MREFFLTFWGVVLFGMLFAACLIGIAFVLYLVALLFASISAV